MPAYNFHEQFAPKIISGEKLFTIRRPRKRPTRQGDILSLYVGQRTKNCRLLRREICRKVIPIDIYRGMVVLNWLRLSVAEETSFTRLDGFNSPEEFYAFFDKQYRLPVVGRLELVAWKPWGEILWEIL